jgi:hypothetical protein
VASQYQSITQSCTVLKTRDNHKSSPHILSSCTCFIRGQSARWLSKELLDWVHKSSLTFLHVLLKLVIRGPSSTTEVMPRSLAASIIFAWASGLEWRLSDESRKLPSLTWISYASSLMEWKRLEVYWLWESPTTDHAV